MMRLAPYVRSGFSLRLRTALFFMVIVLAAAVAGCGTRGDPRPAEEKQNDKTPETVIERPSSQETGGPGAPSPEKLIPRMPDAPGGLAVLYTGDRVVITWEAVAGAVSYRIYRSEGDSFSVAGETVTPAFTDRSVKKDMRYIYRVAAFGEEEGPYSKEVKVYTDGR